MESAARGMRSEDARCQRSALVLQSKDALDGVDAAREVEQPSNVTLREQARGRGPIHVSPARSKLRVQAVEHRRRQLKARIVGLGGFANAA